MSEKAIAVCHFLQEKWAEYSSEVLEILDIGDRLDDEVKAEFTIKFEDETIEVYKLVYHENHINGDGGDVASWVEIPDGDKIYYVGIKGTYSSWVMIILSFSSDISFCVLTVSSNVLFAAFSVAFSASFAVYMK